MKRLKDLIGVQKRSPPAGEIPGAIGDRLRRQRIAFRWRQADVAKLAGVSEQTVKALEKGKSITYENLIKVLVAFGHGGDLLRMLETPNFPNLNSQQRYAELDEHTYLGKTRIR